MSKKFEVSDFIDNILSTKNYRGELGEENHLFKDFDDIVPFLLYYGKKDDIKKQIDLSRRYLFKGFVPLRSHLYSWRMDEYMGGILEYYNKTKDKSVLDIIHKQISFLHEIFENNYIPGYVGVKNNNFSPLSFSRGYNITEVCLENEFLNKKLKKKALSILDSFLENNTFFDNNSLFLNKYKFKEDGFHGKTYPLLANKINFIKDSNVYFSNNQVKTFIKKKLQNSGISRVHFMKDNSNLIYSVIEAYKFTKDEKYKKKIQKWFKGGVLKKMYNEEGFVYSWWENRPYGVSLSQNFTFIDIICEYCYFVEKDDNLITCAEKVANFWLKKRMKNGLIPEKIGEEVDFLDCQTDFSISLYRLSKITKNKSYLKAGRELFESIKKHHFKNGFFVNKVNKEGDAIGDNISIKYNVLFLKANLLYEDNISPFNKIIKDR